MNDSSIDANIYSISDPSIENVYLNLMSLMSNLPFIMVVIFLLLTLATGIGSVASIMSFCIVLPLPEILGIMRPLA